LARASMTSEPEHPQCFCTVLAPIPSTSTAGFERVKVTHRKLSRLRAEVAVVDQEHERKRRDGVGR